MNTSVSRPVSRHRAALALTLALAACALPALLQAQEPTAAPVAPPEKPHYRIPKISAPIKVDGVLDDAAQVVWAP